MCMSCLLSLTTIPYVVHIEVPNEFVIDKIISPAQPTLVKKLHIDKNLIQCVEQCVQEVGTLPNNSTVLLDVLSYKLLGTLHYTAAIKGFNRALDSLGNKEETNLKSYSYICIKNTIAYNSEAGCDVAGCSICDKYKLTNVFTSGTLYSEYNPAGIDLYIDIANDALTDEAYDDLIKPSNCTKSVVLSGDIIISLNS